MQHHGAPLEPEDQLDPLGPFVDQQALNYSESRAGTSIIGSVAGGARHRLRPDDSQTEVSLATSYTVDSSTRMVRREGDREFNVLNELYSLPADDGNRLDKQHRAYCIILQGLYPDPETVRAVLAPEAGVTKRIMDIGCGSGIWCTEMSREFPHCQVLGIDLAPVPLLPEQIPPNCTFEMDDVNRGLEHHRGQYDLVHARTMGIGLTDYRKTLEHLSDCLKPGGMILYLDGDYDFCSGLPMRYVPCWSSSNPQGSYMQRVLYEYRRSAMLGGSDIKTIEKVLEEGFWDNVPMIDPNTCKAGSFYLPIGTWCRHGDPVQQEHLKYIGTMLRQTFFEVSRITNPVLVKAGWPQQLVDQWSAGMREECYHGAMGFYIHFAWGRKRAGPDLPAPAINPVPVDNEGAVRYPFYEVYNTREELAAAAAIRRQDRIVPDLPLPWNSTE